MKKQMSMILIGACCALLVSCGAGADGGTNQTTENSRLTTVSSSTTFDSKQYKITRETFPEGQITIIDHRPKDQEERTLVNEEDSHRICELIYRDLPRKLPDSARVSTFELCFTNGNRLIVYDEDYAGLSIAIEHGQPYLGDYSTPANLFHLIEELLEQK